MGYFDEMDECPECGSEEFVPEGGCHFCRTCGFSPCG